MRCLNVGHRPAGERLLRSYQRLAREASIWTRFGVRRLQMAGEILFALRIGERNETREMRKGGSVRFVRLSYRLGNSGKRVIGNLGSQFETVGQCSTDPQPRSPITSEQENVS